MLSDVEMGALWGGVAVLQRWRDLTVGRAKAGAQACICDAELWAAE